MPRNKTDQIILRVSETEKSLWQEEAGKRGQSLSEFIRFVMNMRVETVAQAERESTHGKEI